MSNKKFIEIKVAVPPDTRYRNNKRYRRDGFTAPVLIEIDWGRLAQLMGTKAAKNSSRKSSFQRGIINAKLIGPVPTFKEVE